MKKKIKGSALAEYALLLVIVGVAAVGGMQLVGANANQALNNAGATIGGAAPF